MSVYAVADWVVANVQMNIGLRSPSNSHNSSDPYSSMTEQRDKSKGPWEDQGNVTMTNIIFPVCSSAVFAHRGSFYVISKMSAYGLLDGASNGNRGQDTL